MKSDQKIYFERDFALDLTEFIKFKESIEEARKVLIPSGLMEGSKDFEEIMGMNGYGEVFSLVIDMSLMDTQRSSEAGVANQTEEEGGVDDGGSE